MKLNTGHELGQRRRIMIERAGRGRSYQHDFACERAGRNFAGQDIGVGIIRIGVFTPHEMDQQTAARIERNIAQDLVIRRFYPGRDWRR